MLCISFILHDTSDNLWSMPNYEANRPLLFPHKAYIVYSLFVLISVCRKHLPGAVYLNPFQDAEHTDLFPRNVPAREKFEALLQGAGLTDVSHVILYDSEGQNGYFIAGRARWHFKVCLGK